MDIVALALERYEARRQGLERPAGTSDRARRWYPAPEERRACCDRVRPPSRAWPWSLWKHCRSLEHVARLVGADPAACRRVLAKAQAAKRPARTAPTDLCLVCGAWWDCEHVTPERGRTVRDGPEGHVYAGDPRVMDAHLPEGWR